MTDEAPGTIIYIDSSVGPVIIRAMENLHDLVSQRLNPDWVLATRRDDGCAIWIPASRILSMEEDLS
jgi:hypothetical protein